ncbi:MAG: DinB family protein [Candidatus Hodarchaeales archaeon]|jgi:hypothetical protein
MKNTDILRKKIKEQLEGSYAHTPYTKILENIPFKNIKFKIPNVSYNLWELLEHIRLSHLDIIEFMEGPNYKEKKWPEEYWPEKNQEVTLKMWEKTVEQIHDLYEKTKKMIDDENIILFDELPHAKGYHYLREFLLIVEHNAYHFGQLMAYKRVFSG